MPFKEAAFQVGLAVFSAGLYFSLDWWGEPRVTLALGLLVVGAVAMGYSVYYHYHPEAKLASSGIWVWLPLALTWLMFGYVIYEGHSVREQDMPPVVIKPPLGPNITIVQPTVTNAPKPEQNASSTSGIAIGGGGTVNNPTVNIGTEGQRTLSDTQCRELGDHIGTLRVALRTFGTERASDASRTNLVAVQSNIRTWLRDNIGSAQAESFVSAEPVRGAPDPFPYVHVGTYDSANGRIQYLVQVVNARCP